MRRGVAPFLAVLSLFLALFVATATAGNGNGNGNGNANAQSNASGTADATTGAQATVQASAHGHAKAQGHANGNSQAGAHATVKAQAHATVHGSAKAKGHATTQAVTAPSVQGVKPSSSTAQSTHNRSAPAGSSQTKLYGNGKTAGQIAMKSGAGASTMLFGPGNSQPHKTACGPHSVDVHALKAHSGGSCGARVTTHEHGKTHVKTEAATQQTSAAASSQSHVEICHATGSATNPFVFNAPSATGVFHGHLGHQDTRDVVPTFTFNGQTYSLNVAAGQTALTAGCASAATQATPAAPAALTAPATPATPAATPAQVSATPATATPASSNAGVKGATHAAKKPTAGAAQPAANASGVKGAVNKAKPMAGAAAGAKLPFTGLPLWIALVAAAALLLAGAVTRRAFRPIA